MTPIQEIQYIDTRLVDLREEYLGSKPGKRKFIETLANALKDKQKRLRESLVNQLQML